MVRLAAMRSGVLVRLGKHEIRCASSRADSTSGVAAVAIASPADVSVLPRAERRMMDTPSASSSLDKFMETVG